MVFLKIYLDGIKYFEFLDPEQLIVKNNLPILKHNQLYKFHTYYKTEKGYYDLISDNVYFVYKDSDKNKHLYEYNNKKLVSISDLQFINKYNTKIYMTQTNDYHIYNIWINQNEPMFILSSSELNRIEIFEHLFKNYFISIESEYHEDYKQIHDIQYNVRFKKKEWKYQFKEKFYPFFRHLFLV